MTKMETAEYVESSVYVIGCVLQETAQRERLLSTLQEDREHLQSSHAVQLEKLRLQLDTQIQKTQLTHSRKVRLVRHLLRMQC